MVSSIHIHALNKFYSHTIDQLSQNWMKGTFTGNSYNSCVKSLIPVETKKSLNESIEDLINTPSSPILQLVLHYTEICGIMWVSFFLRYPVRCTTPISFRNCFLKGHSDVSIPNFHSHFHLEFFFRNAWPLSTRWCHLKTRPCFENFTSTKLPLKVWRPPNRLWLYPQNGRLVLIRMWYDIYI